MIELSARLSQLSITRISSSRHHGKISCLSFFRSLCYNFSRTLINSQRIMKYCEATRNSGTRINRWLNISHLKHVIWMFIANRLYFLLFFTLQFRTLRYVFSMSCIWFYCSMILQVFLNLNLILPYRRSLILNQVLFLLFL